MASSRLSRGEDGTYRYDLKRPLHDGRTSLVWTGEQLVRKLVPLIPPPFANLTRFHGVFAPRAKLRARVIPKPEERKEATDRPNAQTPTPSSTPQTGTVLDVLPQLRRRRPKRHRYRTDWASLLRRVFLVDIMTCAPCQGRLRVVARVDNPDAVHAMLRHLGLLYDPEPDRPTRRRNDEPQLEFAYDFGA